MVRGWQTDIVPVGRGNEQICVMNVPHQNMGQGICNRVNYVNSLWFSSGLNRNTCTFFTMGKNRNKTT